MRHALIAALVGLVLVPLARADGLPVQAGGPAVLATAEGERYAAVPAPGGTVVTRLSDKVLASGYLPGRFQIPQVALDGTPDGLSAGRTALVLITPRRGFPRARTTFAVLDPLSLKVRTIIDLAGDYSFDALSPDGTRLYLVHYQSLTDPTRYEVRAWDLLNERLLPDPVVDPTEVDEEMRGFPITRTTTADGRFAYTLYDGGGKAPFVHALDTKLGQARCIDLDMLSGRQDLYGLRLRLSLGGTRLTVVNGTHEVVSVDTRTYLPETRAVADPRGDSARWLPFAVLSALGLGAAVSVAWLLRRRYRDRVPVGPMTRRDGGGRPAPARKSARRPSAALGRGAHRPFLRSRSRGAP
jgi:hypothetical protein